MGESSISARTVLVLGALFVGVLTPSVSAQPIHIQGNTFNPSDSLKAQSFSQKQVKDTGVRILQFKEPTKKSYREKLSNQGIDFISYIPENAWIVNATWQKDIRSMDRVRYYGPFRPDYKISRRLQQNPQEVKVEMFPGSDPRVLESYGKATHLGSNYWKIESSGVELDRLSGEEAVKRITSTSPGLKTMNAESRSLIGANNVQSSPYNLNGSGFTAAIWDDGWASNHTDLNTTLDWTGGSKNIIGDSGHSNSSHGTHVAGTMLGAGILNPDYRGVAPRSELVTYEWPGGDKPFRSEIFSETSESTNIYGAVLSQNSWGWVLDDKSNGGTEYGDYGAFGVTSAYDNITYNLSASEPLSVVFSAGNSGRQTPRYNSTVGPGATAKNGIAVGAVDDNGDMTSYSSWGPTDDGRIKPTVVADGGDSGGFVRSTEPGNNYGSKAGTSMAAPAVSGVILLLNQQFNRTFGYAPEPATEKALLVHNADDLGRTGPDYKYGWGLVNATASVDYVRAAGKRELIRTGRLADTGDNKSFQVSVPGGEAAKFTLVWNDYPGTSGTGKALINDLDLVVKNSTGGRKYPWTLSWSERTEPADRNREDEVNVVEQVKIGSADPSGYTVTVDAESMPQPSQEFTLLMSSKTGLVPNLTVESPENRTYSTTPDFNASLDQPVDSVNFSVDGGRSLSTQRKNTTYYFNTSTELSDGQHTVDFTAANSEGASSAIESFTVDSTPPSIDAFLPVDEANISGSFNISASVSDATTPVKASGFKIENGTTVIDRGLNSTVNSNTLKDGDYRLVYEASDSAGNQANLSLNLTVDNTKPEILNRSVKPDEFFNSGFFVNATPVDTELNSSGFRISNTTDSFSRPLNSSFDVSKVSDGVYNLTYFASDRAGNRRTETVNITLDTQQPSLNLLRPEARFHRSDIPIRASATDTNLRNATFTVSNESIQDSGAINSSLAVSDVADGSYNVTVKARDLAGNFNTSRKELVVDTEPPQLNYKTVSGGEFFNSSFYVNASVSDNTALSSSNFSLTNASFNLTSALNTSVNSSELKDGRYNITYRVADRAGNSFSEKVGVALDTENPSLKVLSPRTEYFSTGFSVEAEASDALGVESLEFSISNTSTNLNGTLNTSFAQGELADGRYNLSVEAVDLSGKSNISNLNFTLDASSPDARILSPARESLISGPFEVSATASDSFGIADLNLSVTGAGEVEPNTTLDSSDLEDGTHQISLEVSDKAGNQDSETASFTVDNTPPVIQNSQPKGGSNVSGVIEISAEVSDSSSISAAKARWINSSGVVETLELNSSFNSSNLSEGVYDLSFSANDTLGNNASAVSPSITVDRTPPQIDISRFNGSQARGWTNNVTLEATCSDSLSGTREVSAGSRRGASPLNFTIEETGNVSISFSCVDYSGNNVSLNRSYLVDQEAPELVSSDPEKDERTARNYILNLTVNETHSGVNNSSIDVEVSSGEASILNSSNSTVAVNVSGLDYGQTYTVSVNISDAVDNQALFNRTFTAREDPDSGGDDGSGGSDDSGGGSGGGSGGFGLPDEDSENGSAANKSAGNETSNQSSQNGSLAEPQPETDGLEDSASDNATESQLFQESGGSGEPRSDSSVSSETDSPSISTVESVAEGERFQFSSTDVARSIRSVEFRSSRSGSVQIDVENVSQVPDVEPPEGEIYRYYRIEVGDLPDSSVQAANISFSVPRDFIESRNLTPKAVSLQRLKGTWQPLPTEFEGKNGSRLEFIAQTPGFSYYAVVARKSTGLVPVLAGLALAAALGSGIYTHTRGSSRRHARQKADALSTDIRNKIREGEIEENERLLGMVENAQSKIDQDRIDEAVKDLDRIDEEL